MIAVVWAGMRVARSAPEGPSPTNTQSGATALEPGPSATGEADAMIDPDVPIVAWKARVQLDKLVVRILLPVLIMTLVLPLSSFAQNASPEVATPAAASGDFAGLVDIGGGRRLYLECRGSGGPTVVLEAGYRSLASVWSEDLVSPDAPRTMVLEGVAATTRVCMYERPGVAAVLDDELIPSRSDAVPMPRSAQDVVEDLHTLLEVAGVPGPYVLVGHSLGGLFVRLYASTYPEEVAGLVLVDAWYEGLREALSPENWEAYVRLNSAVPSQLADYPDLETVDFAAASDIMAQAALDHPLTGIPLYVVTAGLPFGIPEEDLGFSPDALQEAWTTAQDQLGALLSDARHVIATESAHYVQLQQPDLVIAAIDAVVEAVRDPASWIEEQPSAATPAT